MTDDIEVEIRGPLTKGEYERTEAFLKEYGELVEFKERVFIDYSTFLPGGVEDRKKDIRLRVTNGQPEIMIKIGSWGGTEHRKEISIPTPPGQFDTLVEAFAALGYTKGVLCIRKTAAYLYKGIEFALVEVPGHSYYFEAEKMVHAEEDMERVLEEIQNLCATLNLKVFDKEEFFAYIHQLNAEANEIYEHENAPAGYFKDRFGL